MIYPLLNKRDENILMAILYSFISSAEPVGSRTISRKFNLGLSPASIRNVMSDLEEMGLLEQPHTSAGRVPTDLAFRYYVDTIIQKKPSLSLQESNEIDQIYKREIREIEDLMEFTSKLLALITNHAAVVLLPRLMSNEFQHIEFVRLRPRQILAIFVTKSGQVHNKILELTEDSTQEELESMTKYLNLKFQGMNLKDIRKKLLEEMANEKETYENILKEAIRLCQETLEDEDNAGEIFVGGTSNIFKYPEFVADLEKMKTLFETFEEKSKLVKLLDQCLHGEGLYILIGSESQIQGMENCSFVTGTYRLGEGDIGALGVLGPKRMEYPRVIAVVDYISSILSRTLSTA